MKIFSILILAIAFTSTKVNAQALQRSVKIVDKNGNTLEGMIIDRELKRVESIEFVKDGSTQTLKPADLQSFTIDDRVTYLSLEVEYDSALQNVTTPPNGRNANVKKERVFLEVVIDAPLGLLSYIDYSGRQHFFLKKDAVFTELLNRFYYTAAANRTVFNEQYKQQLLDLGMDCPAVGNRYKTIAYNQAALKRAVVAINKCNGFEVKADPRAIIPSERKKPTFGIAVQGFTNDFFFGGVAVSGNVSFFNVYKVVQQFTDKSFGGMNFSGGAYYELYSRRWPNRLSIFNELTFQSVKNTSKTDAAGDRHYDFNRVLMSNALRLSAPSNKGGRFYGMAGLNYGFRFGTKMENYTFPSLFRDPKYDFKSGFDVGFLVGIGKTWAFSPTRKFTTELRYSLVTSTKYKTELIRTRAIGVSVQIPIF